MMAALDQGVVGVSWYPATLPASKDADESKQMVLLVLLQGEGVSGEWLNLLTQYLNSPTQKNKQF